MAQTRPLDDNDNKEFAPHPKGPVLARCLHVIDLGEKVSEWQGVQSLKPMLQFTFYTGAMKENGEPFILTSREFTNTMGEKANLRRFLEAWRGEAFSDEEVRRAIDLDKLVGKPVQLTVDHATSKKGRLYANIASVSPVLKEILDRVPKLPKPDLPVPKYIIERIDAYAAEAVEYRRKIGAPPKAEPKEENDDDLPF